MTNRHGKMIPRMRGSRSAPPAFSLGIIDRYLLRQFAQIFFICFLSLTGLFVVVDAFSHLDDFLRYSEQSGNLLATMGSYYAYRSVFFFDRTSAVLTMVAAMFTVTWIQRHNELTALMAAGVSRARVVAPMIAAAGVIIVVSAANRELTIPRLRDELSRDQKDLAGDAPREIRARYDNKTDILFRGRTAFANEKRINEPNFLLPPELDDLGSQLVAENAYYQPAKGPRPGGYLLKHVTQPRGILTSPTLMRSGEPAVITPRGAPDWLAGDECFVVSDINFDQLTGSKHWRQFSSTAELIAGLRNPSLDFGADVRVAIHARLVQPLLDFNLLFLGLPLVLRRENRNVFLAIGLCLAITTAFLLVEFASQYLGAISLISPAAAAWLPLVLFVPVAGYLSEPLRE